MKTINHASTFICITKRRGGGGGGGGERIGRGGGRKEVVVAAAVFYYCVAATNHMIKFECERGVTITRRRSVIMKIERTKETDGTRFHEHDFTVQLTLCDHKNKTNKTNGRSKQGWR